MKTGEKFCTDGNAIPTTISINLIKSKIKEWLCIYKKSNQNLTKSWGIRHVKHTTKNFNKQKSIKLLKLQRSELKNIIALYTGHGKC